MSFDDLHSRIDEEQTRIDLLDESEDEAVAEQTSEAFFTKLDDYQDRVEDAQFPRELKTKQAELTLKLLQEVDPDGIEAIHTEFDQTLDNFNESLDELEDQKYFLVTKGDYLSAIVRDELGISVQKELPKLLAAVHVMQKYRMEHGSKPMIQEDGSLKWKSYGTDENLIYPGEYIDMTIFDSVEYDEATRTYKKIQTEFVEDRTEDIRSDVRDDLADIGPDLDEEISDEDIITDEEVARRIEEQLDAEGDITEGGDIIDTNEFEDILEDLESDSDRDEQVDEIIEDLEAENLAKLAELTSRLQESPEVNLEAGFENDFQIDYGKHGYVSVFEQAINASKDWDNPFSDEAELEDKALDEIRGATKVNLDVFASELENASQEVRETDIYKEAQTAYKEEAKRFIELAANVDVAAEDSDARNIDQAMAVANSAIPHMDLQESIEWTLSISEMIDANDFQSDQLKNDFMKLYSVVKTHLKSKLMIEKESGNKEKYLSSCMTLAKHFSGREGNIDSDQMDSRWAAELAREAADMQSICLELLEKGKKLLENQTDMYEVIAEERQAALDWLEERKASGLEVDAAINILNQPIDSIESLAVMTTIIFQYQYMRDGETIPPQNELEKDVIEFIGPIVETAQANFDQYLADTFLQKDSATIETELGISLAPFQGDAIALLSEIEGHGWFDISDKSWTYVALGAKIAATIAIGVGVAIGTGGLGIVAAALIGGASMTAGSTVIFQRGFEDGAGGAVDAYGAEFAVNTATFGAARYLSAGRAIYQLNAAGAGVESAEAAAILRLASQRGGMATISSLDDGMTIGSRVVGATMEGGADVLLGASLDTAIIGGTFTENLQNNAMFFGVGIGTEFGMPAMARILGRSDLATDGPLLEIKKLNEQSVEFRGELKAVARKLDLNIIETNNLKIELEAGTLKDKYPDNTNVSRLVDRYAEIQEGYKSNLSQLLDLAEFSEGMSQMRRLDPTPAALIEERGHVGVLSELEMTAKDGTEIPPAFLTYMQERATVSNNSDIIALSTRMSDPELNLEQRKAIQLELIEKLKRYHEDTLELAEGFQDRIITPEKTTEINGLDTEATTALRLSSEESLGEVERIAKKIDQRTEMNTADLDNPDWEALEVIARTSEFSDTQLALLQKAREGDTGALATLVAGLRGELDSTIHVIRVKEKSRNWGEVFESGRTRAIEIKDAAMEIGVDIARKISDRLVERWRQNAPDLDDLDADAIEVKTLSNRLTELREKLPNIRDNLAKIEFQRHIDAANKRLEFVKHDLKTVEMLWKTRSSLWGVYKMMTLDSDNLASLPDANLRNIVDNMDELEGPMNDWIAHFDSYPDGHWFKERMTEQARAIESNRNSLPDIKEKINIEVEGRAKVLEAELEATAKAAGLQQASTLSDEATTSIREMEIDKISTEINNSAASISFFNIALESLNNGTELSGFQRTAIKTEVKKSNNPRVKDLYENRYHNNEIDRPAQLEAYKELVGLLKLESETYLTALKRQEVEKLKQINSEQLELEDEFSNLHKRSNSEIANEAMKYDWFEIGSKAIIEGQTFFFSKVVNVDGYYECLAFVKTDKGLEPRLFYRSYSDGGWKATDSMHWSNHHKRWLYGKGLEGTKGGGLYTQETRPAEQISTILNAKPPVKHLLQGPSDLFTGPKGVTENMNNNTRYQSEVSIVKPENLSELHHLYNITSRYSGGDALKHIDPLGRQAVDIQIGRVNQALSKQENLQGFVPNFSKNPTDSYKVNHTILGEGEVNVFEGILNGHPVEWHMAHYKSTDTVVIDAIRIKNNELTSFGTYKHQFDAGFLTAKPIEYASQALLGPHGYSENLPNHILNNMPADRQNTYISQKPLLETLLPIKQFRAQFLNK